MQKDSVVAVERWWSAVLALPVDRLWKATTVAPHGAASPLATYGGWWVVRGGTGLHVSLPPGAVPPPEHVLTRGAEEATWRELADERGLRVVGPSRHSYLDEPPPEVPVPAGVEVRQVAPGDLSVLRESVGPGAWEESGFHDVEVGTDVCLAVLERGTVVAAGNLTAFDGAPRDVGVLVAPHHTGRGLGRLVGTHVAAYAVREHGLARWRAQRSNTGSLALSDRLGFDPWCWQLALR